MAAFSSISLKGKDVKMNLLSEEGLSFLLLQNVIVSL